MKFSTYMLYGASLVMVAYRCVLFSIASFVSAFEPLAVYALRLAPLDLHALWQATRALPVTAYRVLGSLKPVYRESYDTHGQSLDRLCLT